ncbi:hypothetical protein [Salinibacterium sp. ZJ70]|uniref:hypothetical protein n=1 Tax=Salinibacterium sp. ZJ70 TaxID=2708084 RepID=UPI00141F1293|nr:hypothetical protein [Salinibacterium sp. ZJ70]
MLTIIDKDWGDVVERTTEIGKADRATVLIILVIGMFGGGLLAGLGLIMGIFRLLDPGRYPIELLADIPVEAGPGILEARATSIIVNAETLPAGALWAFAISDVVGGIAIGLVTACFAYVLWRVAQRHPFHRTTQAAALVAGCAIAFGSLISQGVGGLGRMMAADELNPSLGGVAEVGFLFQPLPIVVGFGVLALAYVFQAGERLQRDTEGLI